MPLVPAKCPSCGGDMQIDGSRKEAFCPYCGTKFLVESAVNYYNTKNEYHIEHADIKVEDSSGLEAKLKNAENILVNFKEYDKAAELFAGIGEEFSDEWRAWWGAVRAKTHEFTGIEAGFNDFDPVFGPIQIDRAFNRSPLFDALYSSFQLFCREKSGSVSRNTTFLIVKFLVERRLLTVAPDDKKGEIQKTWEAYASKALLCEKKCDEYRKDAERLKAAINEKKELNQKTFKPKKRIRELDDEIDQVKDKYRGWKLIEREMREWELDFDSALDGNILGGFFTFEEWGV